MENEKKNRGFSALSDLASSFDGDEITSTETSSTESSPDDSHKQADENIEEESSGSITASPGGPVISQGENRQTPTGDNSVGCAVLAIIGVGCFLFLLVIWASNLPSENATHKVPKTNDLFLNSEFPESNKSNELRVEKPPEGTNHALSASQIRWCLREDIRLETMRDLIDSFEAADSFEAQNEFNRMVEDYNSRCSSFRYQDGPMGEAQRDIALYRNQIITKAKKDAGLLKTVYLTREAQKFLTNLGYDPGPIDGQYGSRTADAVKQFQRDRGLTQNGRIDATLLNALKTAPARKRNVPEISEKAPSADNNTKTVEESSLTADSSDALKITSKEIPNQQITYEAQRLLSELGYDPGPVNGQYTSKTEEAVKQSQNDVGIFLNGWIDESFVELLKRKVAKKKTDSVTLSQLLSRVSTPNAPSSQYNIERSISMGSYFTRGSHQDDVLRVQGTPDNIHEYSSLGQEVWDYGLSSVTISTKNHCVLEWANRGGDLKARLVPGGNTTSMSYFTRGSHQDDVLRVQGTPDNIHEYSSLSQEVWDYGLSSVTISTKNHCVLEWANRGGDLKARLVPGGNTTSMSYFTRGSHQDDVLRVQGTPDNIHEYSSLGQEVWDYGLSSVTISTKNHCVLEWANRGGDLKARLVPGGNTTSMSYFTRGSHQDDVLRVQGTPDNIHEYSSLSQEVWDYGLSSVTISTKNHCVLEWANRGGDLKARLVPGGNTTSMSYFTRGSHQDDVLRVQGTPDSIHEYSSLGQEVWDYGLSSVTISTKNHCVLEWANRGGDLIVR